MPAKQLFNIYIQVYGSQTFPTIIIRNKTKINGITPLCFLWQFMVHSMIGMLGQPGMSIWRTKDEHLESTGIDPEQISILVSLPNNLSPPKDNE